MITAICNTPCGFQIILVRNDDEIAINASFNYTPICLTNTKYRLSVEGAKMLRDKLTEIVDAANC